MVGFSYTCLIALKIPNGSAFLMKNVLTCLLTSRGGSVIDYVMVKECDASMVNTFRIGQLSLDSKPRALYLTFQPKSHAMINALEYKSKRGAY